MKTGIMGILVYCITSAQMFTMHEHMVKFSPYLNLKKVVLHRLMGSGVSLLEHRIN